MSILDFLIGRPLATSEERAEQIGTSKGIPIFGLDALSSAVYGPEAALTLLIPLGLAGLTYILPITAAIIILLLIVFFSYRQTIAAYPTGGGSYTVARENLGTFPGLLAASALMIDYVLTAAVGISAGIGALISAVPSLHSKTLLLCLAALAIITIVNLRGVSEAGGIFLAPTYLFLATMFTAIVWGVFKTLISGGHPHPVVAPPAPPHAVEAFSFWLILKAFSSGCTALTGVEAVSNGVRAFREPTAKTAQTTLAIIIGCLVLMLGGIAYLAHAYQIAATPPGSPHYRSVLSLLFTSVAGRGTFYYIAIFSVLIVLIFSANTAFADFPRVCRAIAEDRFLPISFANRGRRLVYSEGVLVLAFLTAALLIAFGGVTDRLIPLYAVGAFLAFTLSQAGMVAHWKRQGGSRVRMNMFINGLGAFATGITVIVVILAKFVEGAWITVLAIPAILLLMYRVRAHYDKIAGQLASPGPLELEKNVHLRVVVPIQHWGVISKAALGIAFAISDDIHALYVSGASDDNDDFRHQWQDDVVNPALAANRPVPKLVCIESPYRFVVAPIADYVVELSKKYPDCRIVAIVPEVVERHSYNYFLHSQRATLLKTNLLMNGNNRVSVLNVPWYVE